MTLLISPEDVLTAVPFLLGYHPEESLVLIGLTGEAINIAMRVDLPAEINLDEIDMLAGHLQSNGCESTILIAYTPQEMDGGEELLAALVGASTLRAIRVRDAMIVHNGHWRSALSGSAPAPIPPISDTRIAAEQVLDGRPMPLADIGALKESITHITTPSELIAALAQCEEIDGAGETVNSLQREGARALMKLMEGGTPLIESDHQLVAIILTRLHDLHVRDFAMGLIDTERLDEMSAIWRALFRIAPSGYRAAPGSLFAQIAYEQGDGGLAHRILDLVQEDDPKYNLASLLRRAFTTGWPPAHFQMMRAELHPKISALIF